MDYNEDESSARGRSKRDRDGEVMMGPPRRTRDPNVTPPRHTKKVDARDSSERGTRKEHKENYKTPLRPPGSSNSAWSSRGGADAPMRVRRIRARPEFSAEDEVNEDSDIADSLSKMLSSTNLG